MSTLCVSVKFCVLAFGKSSPPVLSLVRQGSNSILRYNLCPRTEDFTADPDHGTALFDSDSVIV